ncbi:hypothetical protein [Caballeronia sp. LZ028]|nr:hypothetical protein [Caballeronia sp. LZ028]MDR5769832.1 hypothetical protein [Caballeronia sp. LZ028]
MDAIDIELAQLISQLTPHFRIHCFQRIRDCKGPYFVAVEKIREAIER